jgi:hypothetical protein
MVHELWRLEIVIYWLKLPLIFLSREKINQKGNTGRE